MDVFLVLFFLATMFGLTASNPLLTVHRAMASGTHISRDLHEIDSADGTFLAGRLCYGTVATISLAILVACFARRARLLHLNNLGRVNVLRGLVIIIYVLGLCFVISGIVLQIGVGLSSLQRCRAAIDICLVFYVGGKVIVYVFLAERAHALRATKYRRYQDWIWIISMIIINFGFGTIAVFAFLGPVVEISSIDGKCRIGLPFHVTLPLLIYDICINMGMTILFVVLIYPYVAHDWRSYIPFWMVRGRKSLQRIFKRKRSEHSASSEELVDRRTALEKLILKSLVASVAILVSTVTNLAILFSMSGREQGWLCFTICTTDVTWGIIVIHNLTSSVYDLDSNPADDKTVTNQNSGFSQEGEQPVELQPAESNP